MYTTTTSVHNPLVFFSYQLDPRSSFVLVPSPTMLVGVAEVYDIPYCPP